MPTSGAHYPDEKAQDADENTAHPTTASNRNVADGSRDNPSIDESHTDVVSSPDALNFLSSLPREVMEIIFSEEMKNDSFKSAFLAKAPAGFLSWSDTGGNRSASIGGGRCGHETVAKGHSDKTSPSPVLPTSSSSRSEKRPTTPIPSSSRAAVATEERGSPVSGFRIPTGIPEAFDGESRQTPSNYTFESDKANTMYRSSWLSSNSSSAGPDFSKRRSGLDSDLPRTRTTESSDAPLKKPGALSWTSSTGSSIDAPSNNRFHLRQAQWTDDMTSGPSSSSSQIKSLSVSNIETLARSSRGREPTCGHIEMGQLPSNVDQPFNLSSPPEAGPSNRKRKGPMPVIPDAPAIEANNIAFVLPPRKKIARLASKSKDSDSNIPMAYGTLAPSERFPERTKSEKRRGKKTSSSTGKPIKVVVTDDGEVLSIDIIRTMLRLVYEFPDDYQFPCQYPQCAESITRWDILRHCKVHLRNLGYRDGETVSCDFCTKTKKQYRSFHALLRHVREEHFAGLRMCCQTCDRTINRGTNEMIRKHLGSEAHKTLWEGLELHWEYRHRNEIDEDPEDGIFPEDTEGEMGEGRKFEEGSSAGGNNRKPR